MKTMSCAFMMALLLAASAPAVRSADHQPHMKAALELLQAAKASDNPMPMLKSAKKHLVKADNNKGGARVQAIEAVNDAMAQVEVGDKEKAKQKITAAIANVHNGMGNSN
jgi:hypothetical protein